MSLPEFLLGENNGREETLEPGTTFRSLLKAESKNNYQPLLINITWSVEPISAPRVSDEQDIIGELEWGISGGVHKAQFDLGRGGQLNISASALHLKVAYPSTAGPTIRVFGSYSPGTRGATAPNQVTLTRHHPTTNAGYVEPVPNFGRTVAVLSDDQTLYDLDQLVVEMLGVDQTIRHRVFARGPTFFDLPNNVFYVRLVNSAPPGPNLKTSLLFGLAL